MSTFTWTPDFGAEKTKKPLVTPIKFGDGYEQRASTGLNRSPGAWALKWENIPDSESEAIDAFLEARGAKESFDWTPPNYDDAIKVVCREWKVTPLKANLNLITATFEQVFEP